MCLCSTTTTNKFFRCPGLYYFILLYCIVVLYCSPPSACRRFDFVALGPQPDEGRLHAHTAQMMALASSIALSARKVLGTMHEPRPSCCSILQHAQTQHSIHRYRPKFIDLSISRASCRHLCNVLPYRLFVRLPHRENLVFSKAPARKQYFQKTFRLAVSRKIKYSG